MNILIINHYAGSPAMGMEFRPYYLGKYWVRKGHQVTILCASFSHLRRENVYQKEALRTEQHEGITYCFVQTPTYGTNNAKRAKNVLTFVRTLNQHAHKLANKWKPDVVIASSTYPFDSYPAAKIAKAANAKLVYEIHDLWPLSLELLHEYSPTHPLIRAVNVAQAHAVRKASAVVSIIAGADRYLAEKKLIPKRYAHIPNGIDLAEISRTSQGHNYVELIRKYQQKGYFVLLYVGGFGVANALETLILSAKQVNRQVVYLLVGNGVERAALKSLANTQHIENAVFLDSISKSAVAEVLPCSDCLYIGAKKSPLYDYGIGMNKLWDYMLSGRPIVCAVEAEDNPVKQADCGLLVESANPSAIAKAVEALQAMPAAQRDAIGKRGQSYVRTHHSYQDLAEKYLAILEE